jgi:hypothetical protein
VWVEYFPEQREENHKIPEKPVVYRYIIVVVLVYSDIYSFLPVIQMQVFKQNIADVEWPYL